jgi:regulator of nucleoside diphosphate kinase
MLAIADGTLPEIVLTDRDFAMVDRLVTAVLRDAYSTSAVFLSQELRRARVVPATAAPGTAVRLGTRLLYCDHEAGTVRSGTLVPPGESRYGDANISVLSMLGAALLGLSEGQSIRYRTLEGRMRTVSVQRVLAQRGT